MSCVELLALAVTIAALAALAYDLDRAAHHPHRHSSRPPVRRSNVRVIPPVYDHETRRP